MGASSSRVASWCLTDTSARDRAVLVTGGNSGIGFALCEQLCKDGAFVFLCARSEEKGEAAVSALRKSNPNAEVSLVLLDVASEESVAAAVLEVKDQLTARGLELYAVVNNAATGLMHGVSDEVAIQTNVYGVRAVSEAFLPLLPEAGRVLNVSSTAGPTYLVGRPLEEQQLLTSPDLTLEQLDAYVAAGYDSSAVPEALLAVPGMTAYLFSKACMNAYTAILARENPHLAVAAVCPGFIDTAINKGMGATATPDEGAAPLKRMLFEKNIGQGWFYEADCKRAGPHGPIRYPNFEEVAEYDGALP
jgi:NAD(P)-dependent dehydrogenase (short-subunit alcohol dehydrogenase family)